MKANQRPALPEEETFVNEAANVLMDYAKLQTVKFFCLFYEKALCSQRAFLIFDVSKLSCIYHQSVKKAA